MAGNKIFLSVGGVATAAQEDFIRRLEDRLRAEGLEPHTVGRNTFGSEAPLVTVMRLLKECSGTVVVALERMHFPEGLEKRGGPNERTIQDVRIPTPWNQIEAAMAYNMGHPLMVIVEHGLRSDGLLEKGYDWYVQWVNPGAEALSTPEFNGVLASWKAKVLEQKIGRKPALDVEGITVGQLISSMKPGQLWSTLALAASLIAGSFFAGYQLGAVADDYLKPQANSEEPKS